MNDINQFIKYMKDNNIYERKTRRRGASRTHKRKKVTRQPNK